METRRCTFVVPLHSWLSLDMYERSRENVFDLQLTIIGWKLVRDSFGVAFAGNGEVPRNLLLIFLAAFMGCDWLEIGSQFV